MTDEEAYRYGKQMADQLVRSGRAIRIGDDSGNIRRPRVGGRIPAKQERRKEFWIGVIAVVAAVALLMLLFK
jgi:hypothetical protein